MVENRVLFFSQFFPPQLTGSSILMGNLLAPFPSDSVHVIRGMAGQAKIDPAFDVSLPQTLVEFPEFLNRARYRLTAVLYPAMMAAALRLHREQAFSAVYTCWPSEWYLEFGYRFHRITGVPLHVHMHDMWSDNQTSAFKRHWATALERRILQAATQVFAITDAARDHFIEKYGVFSTTLEHPVNWQEVEEADVFRPWQRRGANAPVTVVGGIYPVMNQDSVVRLNDAVQQMPDAEMSICTQILISPEELGLSGDRIRIQSLSKREVVDHLGRSAVVCVPLAFESTAPLEIKTVFPTRLLEYLICGRPILVHAPSDSFLARDARERGWAAVVDKPDVNLLRETIARLIDDEEWQRQLVAGAWREARRRDSRLISAKLQHILGIVD